MKYTKKQLAAKARKIAEDIFKLRDAVISAENPEVADTYRGFVLGQEEQSAKPFEDFARNLEKN